MSGFFRRLLGVEPVASSDKMTIFFLNDTRIFIHYRYLAQHGELLPEDQHDSLVDSLDAACKWMVQQGMSVEIPPRDYEWGRSAYLRDPDGHQIEITQRGN